MIHDAIFAPVRDAVRAKGLPSQIDFTYGPPPVPMKVGATRVYMCIDDEAGDRTVNSPSAQRQNPRMVGLRAIPVKVAVYGRSTVQGAHRGNHEDIAILIANMVHVAIHKTVRAAKTQWAVTRTGFVPDETTDGWAGRVHETRFTVDTPISDLTWESAAASEFTFASGVTALDPDGPGASTGLPNAATRIE